MKHPFSRDFWHRDHLRTTWEYKTFAFLLRAVLALAVIIYLCIAIPAIINWAGVIWVRYQSPDRFEALMQEAKESGDFTDALKWLYRRPQSETALYAAHIVDNVTVVPPGMLAWPMQVASAAGDLETARFWQMMSRYRLRYDLVRCSNPELISQVNDLLAVAAALTPGVNLLEEVERDPAALAALLQKVLDYDAEHPMANDPRTTCESFKSLNTQTYETQPRELWAMTRHTLRLATEHGIAQMQQAAASSPAPTRETPPVPEPTE